MNKKHFLPPTLFLVISFFYFLATSHADVQKKVAVLALDTSSAGQYAYIGPAVTEIIKSRIVKPGKIALASDENKKDLSQDNLNALGKAGIDYAISGKIISEGKDLGISLFLLHTGSPVPVALSNASPIKPDQVLSNVEAFLEKAKGEIIRGAQKREEESPQLTPTLLAPEHEDEMAYSKMHPDLLLRSAKVRSRAAKETARPLGFELPTPSPEGDTMPRPTLESPDIQTGEKQGLFAKIFGKKAPAPSLYPVPDSNKEPMESFVYDLPYPEERPVLLPPVPDRENGIRQAHHKGFWSYLWPWGEEEKAPRAGYYSSQLPYPTPEEIEALSMPGERRPVLASPSGKSTQIKLPETPQEKRRMGWLSWIKWPWSKEDEETSSEERPVLKEPSSQEKTENLQIPQTPPSQEKPAESQPPPPSRPSENGPVWQWY